MFGLDCQRRSNDGQTSISSEVGKTELTLDENDEHHSLSVSFSHILGLSKNYLCCMCVFSYFSNPLPPK